MSQDHPEELLAGYVDGALGAKERAVVDAHLASCARCREEVELSRSARTALRSLPEAEVPVGVTGPVLQRVRVERPWVSRIGRRVAVAAAAAVVGLFGWIGYSALRDDDAGTADAPTALQSDAGAGAPESSRTEATAAGVPVVEQDRDFDEAAVQDLAARIAREQTRALVGADETQEQTAMYDAASEALDCIGRGAQLTQGDEAVRVIDARFRGRNAFLGAFLHRAAPGTDPTELEIWVVAQDGCGFLHYAKQRL
jgi:anti-sigma factor RsiW